MKNEYIPQPAIIRSIQGETPAIKTLEVVFADERKAASFHYQPGQFMQLSLLGVGEAPISIASSPQKKGCLQFTIRAMGRLTRAICQLKKGERIYLRGPYGNSFPLTKIKGRNLNFIAGGIGLAPLRSLIHTVLTRREDFGRINILYGAKTPRELCFKEELEAWNRMRDIEVLLTVERADASWRGNVGVVTALCAQAEIVSPGALAFVCGPPLMIRLVIERLLARGFKEEDIIVSLERYMRCGIGKCGHCSIGEKFVCIDGPVFSYAQLKQLPQEERALA